MAKKAKKKRAKGRKKSIFSSIFKKKAKRAKPKRRKTARAKAVTANTSTVNEGVKPMARKRRRKKATFGQKLTKRFRSYTKGAKKESIKQIAISGAIIGAGAIGGAFIASKLPATMDKRIRALIPIVGGIAAHQFVKNEQVHKLGYGLMASGLLLLVNHLMPTANLLAGEEVVYIPELPDASSRAMLGYNPDSEETMGTVTDFGAEDDSEYMGAVEDYAADWEHKQ